jgi:hypothetical protein
MSAGQQDPQRGKREASHTASVAQKLLCWLALACSCCDDGATPAHVDPDDIDGDGIRNEQDICPSLQDPLQHDEDGDGFGDVCDVCPTVVDPLQSDTGESDSISIEDGIGDACDPRPTRNGDRLGALHTFVTDSTPSWNGAGWTIADDRAHASGDARWEHRSAEEGDGIAARLVAESLEWLSTGGSISVAVDGVLGRTCAVVQDRDADGRDELEVREMGGAVTMRLLSGTILGPFEIVAHRGVERRTETGILYCIFRDLGNPAAKEIRISIPTADSATTGQYLIATDNAAAVATSLIVYKSPIACPSVTSAFACNPP